MADRHPARRRVLGWTIALASACLSFAAQARTYGMNDPVPPGATGKVLSLKGKVTQIQGIALAVSGRSESLGAAMRDLGARASNTEVNIDLPGDVLFDFDKASLRPVAAQVLQKVAVVIQAYPAYAVTITGHTDSKGAKAYNQVLSERRAIAVKSWLVSHGVATTATTQGLGHGRPKVSNTRPDGTDDPVGRQKNRRVEIKLLKR